jgi:adenosine deaminase
VGATGIDASLILCTLRHFSPAASLATAGLVERFAGSSPVAALDIAGDEAGHPLAPHLPAFDHVRALGLPVTVHAGEAAGPASVREALDRTGTRRLGHGVRSVEDPALVGRLRDDGIHLEVCPASNHQTSVVASPDEHPVDRLHRAGVSLGLSTDTRAVTDVTLTDEYAGVVDRFGWTLDDLRATNEAALAVAFAPDDVKARVAARLADGFGGGDDHAPCD